MATPNLFNLTTVLPGQVTIFPTNTSATAILSNSASSGQLIKVNALYVANIDTSVSVNCTINTYTAAALGGTARAIISTVAIPANTTLVVITKESNIYLLEDTSLGITAGTASKLVVTCSYEACS